jgi:His/Glu/Gln/Arg/opine family amino acid ABC transporter permease subunit
MGYDWDFSVVLRFLPQLGQGLLVTLGVTAAAYAVALTVALPVALFRISRHGSLRRRAAILYVEFFRGVPLLVLLIWLQYALPILTGWELPAFWVGVWGIGLFMAGFVAEDYRAGIQAVPRGHVEAARALGMSGAATFRRIVFPQAVRVVLGPLLNSFIVALKGSSLLLILAFPELMYTGYSISRSTLRPLEILTVVALIYLALIVPISWGIRRIQHSFAKEGAG